MLTDTIGADATTALRRNAIHKLEQAAAEAVAAGLTWREAKEILEVGYGYSPANTFTGADDLSGAALAVDGRVLQDITGGQRGYLSWSMPSLAEPQWHSERPAPATDSLVVEVPEYGSCIGRDPYWARPLVEQALAEHPNAVRHGVDRPDPAPRDGYPLDELIDLQQQRAIARDRAWARDRGA
jgi:hypothetical protein